MTSAVFGFGNDWRLAMHAEVPRQPLITPRRSRIKPYC
jgi:hypothetical protein